MQALAHMVCGCNLVLVSEGRVIHSDPAQAERTGAHVEGGRDLVLVGGQPGGLAQVGQHQRRVGHPQEGRADSRLGEVALRSTGPPPRCGAALLCQHEQWPRTGPGSGISLASLAGKLPSTSSAVPSLMCGCDRHQSYAWAGATARACAVAHAGYIKVTHHGPSFLPLQPHMGKLWAHQVCKGRLTARNRQEDACTRSACLSPCQARAMPDPLTGWAAIIAPAMRAAPVC